MIALPRLMEANQSFAWFWFKSWFDRKAVFVFDSGDVLQDRGLVSSSLCRGERRECQGTCSVEGLT